MDAVRKAQDGGVVLGLAGVSSTPVLRLDIDDLLLNKPDTFNLFLLALIELQKPENATQKMGWQQVAGIHGLPMQPWDNVSPSTKANNFGYCAHARPTFPTWHRPYLAMLEQTIYTKMADLVGQYPPQHRAKYDKALKDFRLPYWDYYRPRFQGRVAMPGITLPGGMTEFDYDFSLPQIFVQEKVMLRHYKNNPNNDLDLFDNPLFRYGFPASGGFQDSDWQLLDANKLTVLRKCTVRYPETATDAVGSVIKQSKQLNKFREPNVTKILTMMRSYKSYGEFASTSLTTKTSGSLENVHNGYHGFLGGGPAFDSKSGHMAFPPTAAFDPVFWIHHCQIDRWMAIWQAINPDTWYDGQFKDTRNKDKVTDIPPLETETAYPFRHPDGDFWNGKRSRQTKTFGYEYADAKGSPTDVLTNFENTYGWATRTNPQGDKVTVPANIAPLPVEKADVFKYPTSHAVASFATNLVREAPQQVMGLTASAVNAVSQATGASAPFAGFNDASSEIDTSPVAPGTDTSKIAFTNLEPSDVENTPESIDESQYRRDWYVDDIVKRLALNGSFAIFYFIGNFSDADVHKYAYEPTTAGLTYIFASSRDICDNCGMQDEDNIEVTGTNVVTPMLMDYIKIGVLPDLTPANVVPFLAANLKWRIVDQNGVRHNPREVAGFKVGVSSTLYPLSGEGQQISEEYPQIIETIVANSS